VFFFCLNEPADGCGGETPLVKNKELISKLDPEVLRKFEEKQIRYVRYVPDKSRQEYMNWQHVFTTENREVQYGSLYGPGCLRFKIQPSIRRQPLFPQWHLLIYFYVVIKRNSRK